MKKFLASLIFLGMLCGAASADFVYSTTDGKLGIINIPSADSVDLSSTRYEGTKANSIIATYWENNTSNGNGNSKLLFVTPTTGGPESSDTAIRFQNANISAPLDDAENPITLQGANGSKIVATTQSGGSIYIAAGSSVRKYSTESFALEKVYEEASNDVVPNPEINGLLLTASRVYVLFTRNKAESKDIVLDFDGQLSTGIRNFNSWEVASCSKTIQFISNSRMLVGHEEGIDILNGERLVSSDAPVISICSDNGDGFYYATLSNDLSSVYHYSASTSTATALLSNVSGNHVNVNHTDYDTLTVIAGGEMKIYKMEDDSLLKTYTASELGGTPYNITVAIAGGDSASGGSGGCNLIRNEELGIRNFLIILLVVLGLSLRRVKNS